MVVFLSFLAILRSWRLIVFLEIHSPNPNFCALLAILVLAAVLRFAYPGVNSFAGDEAHISLDALRMARGGEFVMAGQPSSVDIPFFPASVWLFALPYAVSPDPLVATWVVSVISLLTVVGVWGLARRWNAWAGLIAALYMAVVALCRLLRAKHLAAEFARAAGAGCGRSPPILGCDTPQSTWQSLASAAERLSRLVRRAGAFRRDRAQSRRPPICSCAFAGGAGSSRC